jgi:hypothetical protein
LIPIDRGASISVNSVWVEFAAIILSWRNRQNP